MKSIFLLFLLLFSTTTFGVELNLVCKLNEGDGRPIPFKFVKNSNGSSQMFRFDKNETRIIKNDNKPPTKIYLVSLEITDTQIRYQTKNEGFGHTSMDINSPLVEQGETRTGTISKIDGSWNEYYYSYGPITEIVGKFKNQYGKCVNRGENLIK